MYLSPGKESSVLTQSTTPGALTQILPNKYAIIFLICSHVDDTEDEVLFIETFLILNDFLLKGNR